MLRFSQRSRGCIVYPTVLGLLGVEVNEHDTPKVSPQSKVKEKPTLEYTVLEGTAGLKRMFTFQEPYGLSLELLTCTQFAFCSAVFGFIVGGIENTKFTVREFKEQNQATIYENTFQAQRNLQDKVAKDFFRGGVPMALKCGSFLFCFSTMTTALSVYRGKTSVSDFCAAGTVTGAIFTLNRGLPGAVSGGVVGLVLGTLTGAAVMTAMWASNVDPQKVRQWQYDQYQKRVAQENKSYLKEREGQNKPEEMTAFVMMTPEERETKTRIIDKLDEVTKAPETPAVLIPQGPPQSMLRKDGK